MNEPMLFETAVITQEKDNEQYVNAGALYKTFAAGHNTMTTGEVAKALNTSNKVILENAKKCLPDKNIKNGIVTLWSEAEVTILLDYLKTNQTTNSSELYLESKGCAMTVKEVSEVLGVSYDLVIKRTHELFPNKIKNGKITYLNEAEITAIKKRIEQNAHLATFDDRQRLKNMPKTNLEKQLLIRQAMQLQNEMIAELTEENERLKIENAEQKPKADYYDTLIERGNSTNIRNTAKELKIPEKQFIKMLQLDGFIYRDKKGVLLPYSEYIQKGFFEIKEWQQGEKSGVQMLITVEGKHFFIKRYIGKAA